MFTAYVEKAMRKAKYEILEDGTFYGEIPGFQGVWGNAATLEECREDLQSVLEEWLVIKLWDNDTDLPVLGRMSLIPRYVKLSSEHGSTSSQRTRKAS
jgi:predicted RNase H-like HicB family nuclease